MNWGRRLLKHGMAGLFHPWRAVSIAIVTGGTNGAVRGKISDY
jgi:hypothetical protein